MTFFIRNIILSCHILLFLFGISNIGNAQVYNYLPVAYSNTETNPTFVSSKTNQFLASATHINNFQKNGSFSTTSLRVSNFFGKQFTGLGLTLNNTRVADSMSYNHVGLIASYRLLLFDYVQFKVGLNYKFLNLKSTKGQFTKYNFDRSDSILATRNTQNVNLAFTLSLQDRFYINYGILNVNPNWASNSDYQNIFPSYQYIRIGDFSNFIGNSKNRELSFLILTENLTKTGTNTSYLTTLLLHRSMTRKSTLKYGGDFGFNDLGYIQLRPSVGYYKLIGGDRWGRRRFFIIKAFCDIAISTSKNYTPYKPAYSFSILIHL